MEICVKPGYYEWNIWVNDEIAWSDGDPVDFLFDEEDPYSIEEYVDLCVENIKELKNDPDPDAIEWNNVNFEIIAQLSEKDFELIKEKYAESLKRCYGEE